jgi:hypothetical protein
VSASELGSDRSAARRLMGVMMMPVSWRPWAVMGLLLHIIPWVQNPNCAQVFASIFLLPFFPPVFFFSEKSVLGVHDLSLPLKMLVSA